MESSLEKLINIDNQALLLYKREVSDYLKGKRNRLITMEVDLTLSCSHCCPNCTFGNQRSRVFIDSGILDKILRSLPETGVKGMIITGGGEPSIHSELGNFVRRTSQSGVDITLTTNGHFVHRHFKDLMHNLKRVRFSIDAASHHTFKYTHGMEQEVFDQIIDNLRTAVQYKEEKSLPIDIGVSFLICEENIHEIDVAVDFYKKIGVNFLHFKPMQLWDKSLNRYYHRSYPEAREILSKLESYKEGGFKVTVSRENYYRRHRSGVTYRVCHGAHFNMIIGADAKAYTCCHFKYNPKYCYGDLSKEELAEILNKVKSAVTTDCFPHCKMDALNQFVEFARSHQEEVLKISRELASQELPLGSKWL